MTIPTAAELPATIPPADGEILERFGAGDPDAFAELLSRHGPMVLRVCRRTLADPNDAEDAFQVTFLALLHKAGTIRRGESVAGWLYKVAYRAALAVRRAARRQTESHAEMKSETATTTDPLAEISARELLAVLDEGLSQLSETYRAPLVLCHLEGATTDEAARQLGWSLSTLKRRLRRGRDVLAGRLARRGLVLGLVLAPALLVTAPVPAETLERMTALAQLSPAAIPESLRCLAARLGSRARFPLRMAILAVIAAVGWGLLLLRAPTEPTPTVAPLPPCQHIAPRANKPDPAAPVLTDDRYRDEAEPRLLIHCRTGLI